MNIAIMSHTKKQDLMVQFCTAYCGILSKHAVCATNATGRMITEATGLPIARRIFRHLIPNVMPQLIVTATMGLGSVILTESTLSFLGLGVKHPMATWGTMINSVATSAQAMTEYTYIWFPVGCLICLTVVAFNFVGDGLRDAFDPKMKR